MINISKNVGKIFENNWKASVSENILYYRPPDAAQSFNPSEKLRFSRRSPCDCFLFNGYSSTLYALELKSVKTNSISFERSKEDKGVIHHYQIESLSKFSKYHNVIAGFILDFRASGNTYFVNVIDLKKMIDNINKKSFNEKDLYNYNHLLIEKRKLKVNYRYNIHKFLEETKLN